MFFDIPLQLSAAQAITTSAASTSIYDVTGAGSGTAPAMTFGNGPTGFDIGTGEGAARPVAYFTVTTNGTGAGTVAFGVEAAPNDTGNVPGTYRRLATSALYVGTDLDVGDVIALPIPPYALIEPGMDIPRFYRFYYDVAGSATVSVTAEIVINPNLGYVSTQYGNNFVSATV
jgi:hypothetical protein